MFHLLNAEWTNNVFDTVLPIWRDKYFWLPVYIFIISFAAFNNGKKAYWFLLFLIATVSAADLISSEVIKKNVKRIRPCNDTELVEVRSLVRCGSGYSFTSNHAANHFAVSFFLLGTIGLRRRKLKWALVGWAVSIAYAQVYVGVHYPIDVLSGAILGILIAKIFLWLYKARGKTVLME
ncbi:MAG: undecaprenyl-diphosphatase [Halioglobus sp.]|jgi:undecaprenyl-diphosphatase